MSTTRSTAPPPSRSRVRWRAFAIPIATGAALLVAGCGGSTPPPSTGTSAQAIKDPGATAYRFSACMREHGVANFPDPVVHSSPGSQSVGIRVTPSITGSPDFKSAQKACNSIMPAPSKSDLAAQAQQQRAHAAGLLSFARCVRAHGINGFPDPNAQGQLNEQTLSAANIDVRAPSVLAAARACIPESDGQVNAAAIQEASSGGGGS
jgi:hypothetical protein